MTLLARSGLGLYRGLMTALGPFVPIALRRRAARGKEDRLRFRERYGKTRVARPKGPIVWVHAASVGESLSVLPLIEHMLALRHDAHVLVTTGTVTSARLMAERLPARAIHQFVPFDRPAWVRRFLKHWRPNLVLWVESEFWPTMLMAVEERHIPAVLVNARLSDRSYQGWQRVRSVAQRVLSPFVLILAQTPETAERLKQLGARRVQTTGNLKTASEPLPFDAGELAALRAEIGARPAWIAASTHDPEELSIAQVHRALKADVPALLTLIAPRHPNRGDALAERLRADGLAVAQRSKKEPIMPETDIYLADTLGELGLLYRACPFAFIGGSLIPHGGQNPLEPARLGLGVLHGPNVANFALEYAALDEACGAQEVDSAESLATAVRGLMADPGQADVMGADARRVVEAGGDTFKRVIARIDPFIRRLPFDAAT